MALCPSHADRKPSLHLTVLDGHEAPVVHCFAGCKYSAIYTAVKGLEEHTNGHRTEPIKGKLVVVAPAEEPLDRWAEKTGVPRDFWERLGVQQKNHDIRFTWPWTTYVKLRNPWNKAISWDPQKPPFIPLWPEPSADADLSEIILAEGEGDTGILRYLGVEAYTVGGADVQLGDVVISGLIRRGCKKVTLVYDADAPGVQGALKRREELRDAGIEAEAVDISCLMQVGPDGWSQEKDVEHAYHRLGEALLDEMGSCDLLEYEDLGLEASDFVANVPIDISWIAKPYLARGAVSLLSGSPKAGKTQFSFVLYEAMRKGGMLLNKPVEAARALVLTENSPLAIKAKMDGLLGGHAPHLRFVSRFDRRLVESDWATVLRRLAQEAVRHGESVFVIDTLAGCARIQDENDAAEVGRVLKPIREVAEAFNIAVWVIHHLTKAGDSPRGSGVFQAEADTLLTLSGMGHQARTLDVRTILLPDTPDPVQFKLVDGEYLIIDAEDELSEVLDALGDSTMTIKQLKEVMLIDDEAGDQKLRYHLKKLEQRGRVTVDKSGSAHTFTACEKTVINIKGRS